MKAEALHAALAVVLGGATVASVHAQDTGWRPSMSVSPFYQGNGDLDSGGEYSVGGVLTSFGIAGPIGATSRAGVTFNYDYLSFSFSDPVGFGGVAPWNIVQRYGISVPLSFGLRDGWAIGVVPSVNWFKENGADTGDSLAWGGIVSASKRFENGNMIGLAVGVYDLIEDTQVFPILLVDWRLSDHWRLINPVAAGPIGPAGLELDYEFGNGWTTGVGGAYRLTRFRLSQTGPVPNGVGEQSAPAAVPARHSRPQQADVAAFLRRRRRGRSTEGRQPLR